MARVKMEELRSLPEADLIRRVSEARTELATLRLKARQGAVEQPHRLRDLRHHVARLQTMLRERTRGKTA